MFGVYLVICDNCGYKWVAVAPTEVDAGHFECAICKKMSGCAVTKAEFEGVENYGDWEVF